MEISEANKVVNENILQTLKFVRRNGMDALAKLECGREGVVFYYLKKGAGGSGRATTIATYNSKIAEWEIQGRTCFMHVGKSCAQKRWLLPLSDNHLPKGKGRKVGISGGHVVNWSCNRAACPMDITKKLRSTFGKAHAFSL